MRLLLVLLLLPAFATAQPATDLFLVALDETDDAVRLGAPENVTDRAAYDNQPHFTPDGTRILYTSQRGGQTEIYAYELATGRTYAVTDTPESEYSATVIPGGDAFTVIRVEADGTQRLWEFNMAGTNPQLALPDVAPVGYHAWSTPGVLGMFVLGDPPTMQLTDADGGVRTVFENVGRSMHRIPGSTDLSVVQKRAEDDWQILRLNPATRETTPLVQTRAGREDYCWTPGGTILMGDGGTVWAWQPGRSAWIQIADFTEAGVQNITRCHVHPDGTRLVFVADR